MNRVSWEVFNKRSEKLWLRTRALSNPRANPQISMLHCFQEVHSHQHQAEGLETVQALQAMELDGRACVCVLLLAIVNGMCLCQCVHRRMTDWERGLSRRFWAQAWSFDQKNPTITYEFLSTKSTADSHRDTMTSPQIICSLETVVPYGFIKSSLIFTWPVELFFIHSVGSKSEILPFK